jgi:hypothetical protein
MKFKTLTALAVGLLLVILGRGQLLSLTEVKAVQAQPGEVSKPKPKITFAGGPGDTPQTAVIIKGAPNSQLGIAAEYYYLEKKFGRRNVDWKLLQQQLRHQDGKHFDVMQIQLKDGAKNHIYFDITEFFGKL